MMKSKNVPKIRFKGLFEEWELAKINDFVEIFNGLTYSPSNILNSGGTLVLRSSNVKNGEIVNADNVYVSSEIVNSDNVLIGDIIVVVRNGSRSLIGKHAIVKRTMNDTVIGAFMTGLRYKQSTFLNALLNTNQFDSEIAKNLGATINQITNGAFKAMQFIIPKSFEEQTAIGNYFQNIDELINTSQNKLDKLKNVKKACLGKMFPKKGSAVPEIRFAGFMGEWVEVRLGDFGEFKSNGVDKKSNINEIPVNLLNYMDVYNRRKINAHNCNTLMPVTARLSQVQDNDVKKNDVFFTPSSETPDDIGKVMVIEETLPNTVYSYHLVRYRPKENCFDTIFPNYGFSCDFVRKQMILAAQGVQRFVINRGGFEELRVMLPLLDEQKQIGSFFTQLDSLTTKTEQQINKLKNIKKACLEKMFVNTTNAL